MSWTRAAEGWPLFVFSSNINSNKMSCIFCASENDLKSIEQIVNESLVNCHYTLDIGNICGKCNNNFSVFENKVLTQSIIGMERTRLGVTTKKGKAAKAKTGAIEFEGDEEFKKNYITITGLEKRKSQISTQ
jgi:hypothetical protein